MLYPNKMKVAKTVLYLVFSVSDCYLTLEVLQARQRPVCYVILLGHFFTVALEINSTIGLQGRPCIQITVVWSLVFLIHDVGSWWI